MAACEFDKEGIITDVYGRFAVAIGFNMNGRVVIRAESLSLKLRTSWMSRGVSGGTEQRNTNNQGIFNGACNNDISTTPNLAKILTVGDRITFDAVAIMNGSSGGIRWVGAPGSVRVVEVCTRTKIYNGYANIIEISSARGILSFADKKISFDQCATFPCQATDLTKEFRLGDMTAFVAVEQSDATTNCQWRAISVEKFSPKPDAHIRQPPLFTVPPPPRPPQALPVFAPIDFTADSPPQHVPSPPQCNNVPNFPTAPSPRPNGFFTRPPGAVHPRNNSRNRQLALEQLPSNFDLRTYTSLPERMTGHGRVTYNGVKCSILQDTETRRKIFFYNFVVKYPLRGKYRKPFGVGSIVYFEAERTTMRANLQAYYEARRVNVVEEHEERRWNSRWQANGDSGESTDTASIDAILSLDTNPKFGGEPDRFERKRRPILPSQSLEVTVNLNTGKHSVAADQSPPGINKKQKIDDNGSIKQRPLTNFDARHRIQQARAKQFEVDRAPIDDKIDIVQFDRKPASYSQFEAPSETSSEEKNEEQQREGTSRRCVLRSPPRDGGDPFVDLDEFMNYEENMAEMFEFEDD